MKNKQVEKIQRRKVKEVKLQDYQGFFDEIAHESDRAAAIIGTAFLDQKLRDVLNNYLVDDEPEVSNLIGDDDKVSSPIGTFSARISACYCLGLISKEEKDDLNTLRAIRNKFAHELHGMSFEDEVVSKLCGKLKYVKRIITGKTDYKNRHWFTVTASLMASNLELKSLSSIQQKRKIFPDMEVEVHDFVQGNSKRT